MPRLLFLSPTFPDTTGNGLAMRAGMWLEALSKTYAVTLVVVPLFGDQPPSSQAFVRAHCAEVMVAEAGAAPPASAAGHDTALTALAKRYEAGIREAAGSRHFDVIHCFRLYLAPLALSLAQSGGQLWLDMDDMESSTAASLSDLYAANGLHREAEAQARDAGTYAALEAQLLPAFERVFAGSRIDSGRIAGLTWTHPILVPNAVRLPARPIEPLTTHPFTFLFAGTLGYYPNQDAVMFFCTKVLPLIRARTSAPLRVRIAGAGAPPNLAPLARIEGVRFTGHAEDMAGEYADAEAVVVPIRGGGGTRIKVLEAFAYQRPVISTSAGIEGIEATPGEHFLLADTPQEFADQCVTLMNDTERASALAQSAYQLVTESYSQTRINQIVAGL